MAIDTVPTTHRPPPTGWHTRYRVVAWALVVLWLGLWAATLLLGTRESTYADLRARVAAGEVDRVAVAGEGLPPGAEGYVHRELRWRDGLALHTAGVIEASSPREAEQARRSGSTAVAVGRVEDDLRRHDQGLGLTTAERSSSSFTVLGTSVPDWVALGWLGLLVTTFFVAGGGPTWRATPWGWGWFVLLVPPYGALAFLLLGGPTGLFPPRAPGKRLTGGWAFLLALLLGGGTNAS